MLPLIPSQLRCETVKTTLAFVSTLLSFRWCHGAAAVSHQQRESVARSRDSHTRNENCKLLFVCMAFYSLYQIISVLFMYMGTTYFGD